MQNRQKDEIMRDILAACNGGSSITRIMFYAYTTHTQTRAYLELLISKGLIERDPLSKSYFATPNGLAYLRAIESITDFFPVARRSAAEKNQYVYPL